MSAIPKILNLFNKRNITTIIARKLNYSDIAGKKPVSKRFELRERCPAKPKKCIQCDGNRRCGTKMKKKETDKKCVPFECKEDKTKKSKTKPDRKPKKCTPSMRNKCDEIACEPTCTLVQGYRRWSTNDCPRDFGIKGCPQGKWESDL